MNITSDIKTVHAKAAVAAGSTNITDATVIDMAGYEGVRFIYLFGAVTAGSVSSVGVAGKDTNDPTPGTDDLAGSGISVTADTTSSAYIVEIAKPTQRYLRPFVNRATQNAVLSGIVAELYSARQKPVAKDATISAQEIHASPAKGTA